MPAAGMLSMCPVYKQCTVYNGLNPLRAGSCWFTSASLVFKAIGGGLTPCCGCCACCCLLAYYGWHPADLVSNKIIAAAEQNWTVPVETAAGGWSSGYNYMAHPNVAWSAVHLMLVALLLLVVLLFLKRTVIGILGGLFG